MPGDRTAGGCSAGAALLAVLWLSAALAAIAFAVANTVRAETERAANFADGVRAYYLAAGAVDRALLYMLWGQGQPTAAGRPRYYAPGMSVLRLSFPGGETQVEIIPETAKMDLNSSPREDLYRLVMAVGAGPERAVEITQGIQEWRSAAPAGALVPLDASSLAPFPSFRPRHASFEEIEELLLVRGMTPELYYGGYHPGPDGRLIPHGGLRDCVSVYGATDRFDANTAEPAVLAAAGLPPSLAAAIVEMRRQAPFQRPEQLAAFGPAASRLRVGGEDTYTIRATARLRLADGQLSDLRRTVAALVAFLPPGYDDPYHVLRWYDDLWVR